jgi:hypothetical protein
LTRFLKIRSDLPVGLICRSRMQNLICHGGKSARKARATLLVRSPRKGASRTIRPAAHPSRRAHRTAQVRCRESALLRMRLRSWRAFSFGVSGASQYWAMARETLLVRSPRSGRLEP